MDKRINDFFKLLDAVKDEPAIKVKMQLIFYRYLYENIESVEKDLPYIENVRDRALMSDFVKFVKDCEKLRGH